MKATVAVVSAVFALCAAQAFAATHTEVTKAARIPFLRGMGFDGYYQNRNGSFMTDPQLYKRLAAKGFDHIRLPINFIEHSTYDSANDVVTLKETGSWGRPGFSTFDKVIDYAEAAGLYIYLDFHGLDKFPVESETNRKQYIAAWKAVAERYKNRSNKLIFELWNEPHWELSAPPVCEVEKAVIKEIRKTNPTRLILFDAPGGGGSWTLTAGAVPPMFHLIDLPENDNNIAIVVHEYTPIRFSHQGETWAEGYSTEAIGLDEQYCTGTNDNGVAQYSTPRKELLKDLRHPQAWADWSEVPLIINEFNISTALVGQNNFHYEDITEYMSIITRFCESNNIPWTPWCYRTSYGGTSGMDCYDTSNNILPFIEPGLFPDLTPTDKFRINMYSKAVDITFSGYTGSSALANFPVLVKLSEDTISGFRYSDFSRKDGFDLCFTDSSGNLIPHEIDTWDTNGVSKVWVKVPSLTASTKIVARYGCTTNPIVPKVESVWDSDYVGVWHMGERKLPLADSSNESRDVTSRDGDGVAFGAAGVVGGSVGFGATGASRCVNMDDHRLLDGFTNVTIEAWTMQDAHATAGIVSKRNGANSQASYFMYDNGTGTTMKYSANGSATVESGVTLRPELGRWNHQAYSLDATKASSNSKGYLNGALAGTANVSLSGGIYAGDAELHVGNFQSDDARNFPGRIDEVRISKCVRSADWIKASYDTVEKATFATYKLQGASAQDPTLYVVVDGGATNSLDASEVKTWTTRIVKNGEGTVVAAPVSSTSITNMTVLCGAVKLASSAPASVVSKIGEHAFADGTELDLSGKSYSIANLKGAPSVKNAATFKVTGSWTVDGAETMSVAGALVLTGASVTVPDESVFADVGHSGFPIATATGGITGVPSFTSDDFALKLSADGKSLLLYYIAADTPDWTTFAKAVTVTFVGYSGTSQLTDFPALVRLSPAISGFSYADFRKPDGGDLRFSDADGNLIPHDIDTWNPDGESTVWVKVPAFAKNGTVKAYYGCANPVKALSAKDVWDDDYVGVWHLGESALPLKESSETSVDFTSQTSQSGKSVGFAAGGIVGGSVDFKNLGYNAIVAPKTDKLDGFDKFTIEAWTFQKGLKAKTMGILSKRQMYNFEAAYYIQESANSTNMVLYVGTNRVTSALWSAGCSAPTGAWNHVAYSIDMTTSSQNARSFVNGVRKSRSNIAFRDTMPRTDSVLVIGNTDRQGWDGVFNGRVDEVRISKVDRSDDWLKATHDTVAKADFATYAVEGVTPVEPDRILYVPVAAGATNTLDAALVTEYITNIVKQGAGTLVASAIPNYTGDFTLEGGVFSVGVKNGAGKDKFANTIYVGPGASLEFTGTVGNILDNKKVILDGAAATGAPGKFVARGGWNKIGDGMSFVLRSDITWAVANGQRASVSNADFDLGGHTLTMAGEGRQSEFDSTTFRNPGHIVVGKRMTIYNESGNFTFQTPSSGSPTVTLGNGATFNVKGVVSASGWTLYATNGNTVCANAVNWPNTVNKGLWDGNLVLGNTAGIARHSGGYGVSNTVFNLKGPVSGSGRLLLGPGWLNLHTADNTYSGSVTVDGQCTNSTVESFRPILPGGGGIGLWNGAACFPNASSITFTNTARLAFMDSTACSVPNVKFVALAGEAQSISGGVYTARSTIAGIVKEGAGTLVVDSPVSVTGLADIQAGTLKVAYTEPLAATQEGVLAKMPQFASLKFASGTALDLSDNVAFVVGDVEGLSLVTNSGLFGVTGKWTLNSPTDKLTVTGQNARFGDQVVAGCLAFQGATFEIPSDKDAAFVAAAEANGGKIEVARANWVVAQLDETTLLPMPTASASTNPRWSMQVGTDGRSVMLVLAPAGGYAAWIAGKGLTGAAAASDKVTNGIANGVRYAFDIDPATSEIGTPIIQVVRDANGNPSVQSRDLATGRDDVAFGILATPDLTDWSNAKLVPMEKFATDGLWRPTESETSGYVFPSQMFFKYTLDIQQ